MNILKRLAGLGIALRHKFTHDIFFSTHIEIVASLIVLVAVITGSFILLIEHVRETLLTSIVESLDLAVKTGISDPSIIADSHADVKSAMYITILIVVLFSAIVGIVVSHLAVTPIRRAFDMQKRFISGIAHELRTPLSILRMNNEIARLDIDASSPIASLLEENIADVDRVSEMLNNLLLFERMTAIESFHFGAVDLAKVATDIAQRLSGLAAQKNITVSVSETPIPLVLGNRTALEQVFFNIMKNAISYTESPGTVTIAYAGKTDKTVSVRISDTGVGIPERDLPHIFEPFYRTDKTGKLSGTGMGLAVVYEIVKLHKGAVSAKSTEGKGTTFTLTFPMHPSAMLKNAASPFSQGSLDFAKE